MKANSVISLVGSGNRDRVTERLQSKWEAIHRDESGEQYADLSEYMHAVKTVLVDSIRYASTSDLTVGPDVHIASIRRPQALRIVAETHFASATRHPARIHLPSHEGVERVVSVEDSAVTGWVLALGTATAPSYLVGSYHINGGFSSITMNGEQQESNVRALFQSIKRRRD